MNQAKTRRCPACRQAELQPATRVREFHPRGRAAPVRVELLTSVCPSCGAEATSAAQHSENLKRLKARKAQYGGVLLGEEIFSLRRRYGITQQAAAKIFGKGKIAFSRYENETSYPDDSATLLLTLAIEKPEVIRSLADKAGVELPLWEARCEDERRAKLHVMSDVLKVDTESSRAPGVGEKRVAWFHVFGGGLHREASYTFDHSKPVVSANDDHYAMKSAGFA
ncbi:MAG TPA: type II TA system antitoxin MqsA family protein [Thermomonas sp.]